ncbi:MAG TPA: alpha/beta fold hydrolase [Candidatus Polarisedimenticolia bacterium]|nr:alpha/beta fold hydrolase [Candidatus Polarisedimenticolia bacterium]
MKRLPSLILCLIPALASINPARAAAPPAEVALPPAGAAAGSHREMVIVLHGMGRTRQSMKPLAKALEEEGYEVLNFGYPSRSAAVAELAEGLAATAAGQAQRPDVDRIHMVGHSLGNILIRWVVANRRPPKLGRIVMLAPPNRGSRRADFAAPWLTWLSAPLPELTTRDGSTVLSIPTPPDVPIGIIAGSRDGTVPISQTFLPQPCACDHVVVPSGHTFIMRRSLVHQLTAAYLRKGSFFD